MADRMQRVWSQGTTLGFDTLVLGAEVEYRVFPSASLEAATDRSMRDFTITRIVGKLQFESQGNTSFMYGFRLANEAEPLGTYNPGHDQAIDWMIWGGTSVLYPTGGAGPRVSTVEIDNRSQRKSRGMDSSLRLYVYNAAGSTGYVAWHGRVLSLI